MKYAWIENTQIRDTVSADPFTVFHEEIAKFYSTEVPDEASNGDGWVDGQLIKPEIVEATVPEPATTAKRLPKVSVIEWKMLFTAQERIAAKTSVDPIIQDLQELMNDPRTVNVDLNLKSIQDALDYMTSIGILEVGRKEEILLGEVK